MTGEQPKPQRPRKRRAKKQKPTITVNVETNQKKPKPQKRMTVVHDSAGGERLLTAKDLNRALRRIKKKQKEHDGPKVDSIMSATVTLGTLDGTTTVKGLARKHKILLNPLFLKPADSSETPTPLTMRASQYSLYKIRRVSVRLMPLVGKAVVAGSLALIDVQQTGAVATPDNLDDIKARSHSETPIGHARMWRVPQKDLVGPRDGWWYVDTNDDPTQSMGPALNFWLYGKTSNLFGSTETKTLEYSGPVFLAELRAEYMFANYTPKPGLTTLVKRPLQAADSQLTLTNGEDGALNLQISNAPSFLRIEPRLKEGETSEILWAVAGAAVDGVSTAFPQWGWLIRAGWFVVRRIFGKTRAGDLVYRVYASAEDAVKDFPVRVENVANYPLKAATFQFTQLNSPNLNVNDLTSEKPAKSINQNFLPSGDPVYDSPRIMPIFYKFVAGNYLKWDPRYTDTGGQTWWMNASAAFCGYAHVHQVQLDNQQELIIRTWAYNSGRTTADIKLQGDHFLFLDFAQTGFLFGLSQDHPDTGIKYKDLGVLHTSATLTETMISTREQTDQENLYKLLEDTGGKFQVDGGASWMKLLAEWAGTFMNNELAKSFLNFGWSKGHLEPGKNLRYAFVIPTSYLGQSKPWEGKHPSGQLVVDSAIVLMEGNMYGIATSSKQVLEWNYQGPQWFVPVFEQNASSTAGGVFWYEQASYWRQNDDSDETDTDSDIEVVTRKHRSGKNVKQN